MDLVAKDSVHSSPGELRKKRAPSRLHKKDPKASKQPAQKSHKQLMADGRIVASGVGIDHAAFQKAHYQAEQPPDAGHWHGFLSSLARKAPHVCVVCANLWQRFQPSEQEAQANEASHASDATQVQRDQDARGAPGNAIVPVTAERPAGHAAADSPPAKPCKVGRPRKDEPAGARFNLTQYLARHRRGLYRETATSQSKKATFFCVPCGRDISFHTHTDKGRLDRHEKESQRHQKGLKALQSQQPQDAQNAICVLPAAQPKAGPCSGVNTQDCAHPISKIQESIRSFVRAGCPFTVYAPGERDPFSRIIFEQREGGVVLLRSTRCEKHCKKACSVCEVCVQDCNDRKFRDATASRSFELDLITFAGKLVHESPEAAQAFRQVMEQRDYRRLGLAGGELEHFTSDTSGNDTLKMLRRIRSKFDCVPNWRKSASWAAHLKNFLPQDSLFHGSSDAMLAHAALSKALTGAVVSGRCRQVEIEMASKIASGALRSDALLESLVTGFFSQARAALLRPCSSNNYSDLSAAADALASLGKSKDFQSLLRRYNLNPRALPRAGLDASQLPRAFGSLSTAEQVREAFRVAAGHLHGLSDRLHIMVDETVWSASYNQVRRLQNDADYIVGGFWSLDSEETRHMLPAEEYAGQDLPVDNLARVSLHFTVQRTNTRRFVFDTAFLPKKKAGLTGAEMLDLSGRYLAAVTGACNKPPLSMAFDGATINMKLNLSFCGLVDEAELEGIPFFSCCTIKRLQNMRFWPFGQLIYSPPHLELKFAMLGMNGGYHIQKRFSLQFAASVRKVLIGDVWVDTSVLLQHGLPHSVYSCGDCMSDRDAVARLTPPYLGRSCFSLGAHVAGMLAALFASFTTGSRGYSKREHAVNSFTLYFILLLHLAENKLKHGRDAACVSLSAVTVKNMVCACAHAINCAMTDTEPQTIQELGVENWFSMIKGAYRGSPTVKDGLLGSASVTLKQIAELRKVSPEMLCQKLATEESRDGLDEAMLQTLSAQGCRTAIEWYCYVSVDLTPDDAMSHLQKWFETQGPAFFGVPTETDQPAGHVEPDELDADSLEVVGAELDGEEEEPGAAEAQRRLETLQMVQDRAAVQEEVEELLRGLGEASAESQPVQDADIADAKPATEEARAPAADSTANAVQDEQGPPKTLGKVMKLAIASTSSTSSTPSVFALGEASGHGERACLERIRLMATPMRSFIRHCRDAESIVSSATLFGGLQETSEWNKREHLLHLARRRANLSAARISRCSLWSSATQKICKSINEASKRGRSEADTADGLLPVQNFWPCFHEEKAQVLLCTGGMVCCTLSVYRGALLKSASNGAKVRASKPFPSELPAICCKRIHAVELEYLEDKNEWIGSNCHPVHILDPVERVLGQLCVEEIKRSSVRLHLRLTGASQEAVKQAPKNKEAAAAMMGPAEEKTEPAAAAAAAAPDVEAPAKWQFTDRSFTRASMEGNVMKFLRGLNAQLEKLECALTDEHGNVELNGHKHSFETVVQQAPSYFLQFPGSRENMFFVV